MWIEIGRGFCRGEFNVWSEWGIGENTHTHDDKAMQRIMALGPTVIERFLKLVDRPVMTHIHFEKVFANLVHDWHEALDAVPLRLRPYKLGPVVIVPNQSSLSGFQRYPSFLSDQQLISERTVELADGRRAVGFVPANELIIPWRSLYHTAMSGRGKATVSGLVRLYSAILKTYKPSSVPSENLPVRSEFRDPLVILASARNLKVAYECCWFEVQDWIRVGRKVMAMIVAVSARTTPMKEPILLPYLAAMAAPGGLLRDKILMYRNLPFLRKHIEGLRSTGEFDCCELLLEKIEAVPVFRTDSAYPMTNMEWARDSIRAFSSMVRQVATRCSLDLDRRPKTGKVDESGVVKDAGYYLQKLLSSNPYLTPLKRELEECVSACEDGVLTPNMSRTLARAFDIIVQSLTEGGKIPDPRSHYERDSDFAREKDGILVRVRERFMPEPFAMAFADIQNLKNLPRIYEIFNVSYEHALDGLVEWTGKAARDVAARHVGVRLCSFDSDTLLFEGPSADTLFEAMLDLVQSTTKHLHAVDKNQLQMFGLLPVGIAWCESRLGPEFEPTRAGWVAYGLCNLADQAPGTIAVSDAIQSRLSPENQNQFVEKAGSASRQGRIWTRVFDVATDKTT